MASSRFVDEGLATDEARRAAESPCDGWPSWPRVPLLEAFDLLPEPLRREMENAVDRALDVAEALVQEEGEVLDADEAAAIRLYTAVGKGGREKEERERREREKRE